MKHYCKSLILLFSVIILSFFACNQNSEPNSEPVEKFVKWDGNVATSIKKVEDDTYYIQTAAELAKIAAMSNDSENPETFEGKTVKLMVNIDLDNITWTPIAEGGRKVSGSSNLFKGTFDGNNKIIKNLTNANYNPEFTYSATDSTYSYGLIAMTKDAKVRDLTLMDVSIDTQIQGGGGDSVGALIGYNEGDLLIENVVASGEVKGFDAVAGIVGRCYGKKDGEDVSVNIKDCTNKCNVTASDAKVSGVLAFGNVGTGSQSGSLTVENCKNEGTIYSTSQGTSYVSGIVNFGCNNGIKDTLVIRNNLNSGLVKQAVPTYISYAVGCAGNSPKDSDNDVYDFTYNLNTGNYEIEALADLNLGYGPNIVSKASDYKFATKEGDEYKSNKESYKAAECNDGKSSNS